MACRCMFSDKLQATCVLCVFHKQSGIDPHSIRSAAWDLKGSRIQDDQMLYCVSHLKGSRVFPESLVPLLEDKLFKCKCLNLRKFNKICCSIHFGKLVCPQKESGRTILAVCINIE